MFYRMWAFAVAVIVVGVASPFVAGQAENDKADPPAKKAPAADAKKKKARDDLPPFGKGKAAKGLPVALTYWPPTSQLIGIDEVLRELKLDDKQQDTLKKAQKAYQDAMLFQPGMNINDRLKKQQEAVNKLEEAIKDTLKDKTKRLDQIAAQGAGLHAYFTPARRQQLELTDEQLTKGKAIIDATYKELYDNAMKGGLKTSPAVFARSPENRGNFINQSTIKLLELLTKEQNKRWLDIVGDPLQPEVLLKVRTGTTSGFGGFGPINPPIFNPKGGPGKGGPPGAAATRITASQRALAMGNYAEAETFARQALDLAKEPTVVRGEALVALAAAQVKLGRAADAESSLKDAMALFEKKVGPYNPRIAAALTLQGDCADLRGQLEQADKLHRKALELNEKVAGANSGEAAVNWNAIGLIAIRQQKLAEAELALRKALEIRENTLGKVHVIVAQSAFNLGQLYRNLKKYKEAEQNGLRALDIYSQLDHPDVVLPMNLMSSLYVEQKRWNEAEKQTQAWLQLTEKAAKDSASSLAPLDRLASILTAMGRAEEAAAVDQRRKSLRDKLAAAKKTMP